MMMPSANILFSIMFTILAERVTMEVGKCFVTIHPRGGLKVYTKSIQELLRYFILVQSGGLA